MSDLTFNFKGLFEQIPVAVIVSNPDQLVLFSNDAARKLFISFASEGPTPSLKNLVPVETALQNNWKNSIELPFKTALLSMQTIEVLVDSDSNELENSENIEGHLGHRVVQCSSWHISHTPLTDSQQNLFGVVTVVLKHDGQKVMSTEIQPLVSSIQSPDDFVPSSDMRQAEQTKTIAAPSENVPRGSAEKSNANLSILLVEDNEDLRTSTSELLQFLGHRVVHVPDAEQALRQLNQDSFDVLFTDLTLPKMTGAELARQVIQHHHKTSVIITSGYGRAMANAQSLDAVFIPKPYRFPDLEEVLKNLVRR